MYRLPISHFAYLEKFIVRGLCLQFPALLHSSVERSTGHIVDETSEMGGVERAED